MSEDLSHEVTRRLRDWQGGDRAALGKLTPLVYDELRRLASHYLRGERRDHTLQGTALVHEAFIRLVGQSGLELHSRAHFVGVAARLMFPPKVWMIITIGGWWSRHSTATTRRRCWTRFACGGV